MSLKELTSLKRKTQKTLLFFQQNRENNLIQNLFTEGYQNITGNKGIDHFIKLHVYVDFHFQNIYTN